jgi:hypothetical protein
MEGDSSDDEGDRFLPDDTVEDPQGIEDISLVPLVHGVTVTLRHPRIVKTWTAFQHDATSQSGHEAPLHRCCEHRRTAFFQSLSFKIPFLRHLQGAEFTSLVRWIVLKK